MYLWVLELKFYFELNSFKELRFWLMIKRIIYQWTRDNLVI